MRDWPEPPRWLVWISGALVALGAVVCVLGALRIGVTVDETFHVARLQNYFDHGWYLLDDDLTTSGDPGRWVGDAYVYAPVTTLLLHSANVLLGHETWSSVATTPEAYAVRHLGIALVGAVGVAATAVIARVVSGSWRWGIVAAGVLSTLPMWWGHAMFNVKDTPVGTGYTLVTLGCVLVMTPSVRLRPSRAGSERGFWVVSLVVGVGVLLTLGTRPAMWVALAPSLAWTVLVMVKFRSRSRSRSRSRPRTGAVALAAGAGVPLLVLALVYPSVFARPDLWVLGSVFGSSDNEMVSSRGHLPFAIVTTVPIVLLVVGLLGSYGRLSAWRSRPRLLDGTTPLMVLLLAQALLMPVLLVVSSAPVSGGLRHVLFAAPAVAVLVAAGLAQLLDDVQARGRQVLAGVAAVGMVVPAVAQVQLFPYSYGYVNELASVTVLDSSADFWQASLREYDDELVAADRFVVCGADVDGEGRARRQIPNGGQSWLAVSQDCTSTPQGVLTPYAPSSTATDRVSGDFVALRVRFDPPTRGCRELARVTRPRLFDTVVLSTAELCPLVLLPYEEAVTLDGAGRGAGYLLGGWTGNGGDPDVVVEDRASLGFAVAGRTDDLGVRVTGTAAGEVDFLLNNEPARVRPSGSGWVVTPRGPLPAVGDPDHLVLTVVADSGDVRVSSVALAEEAS